MAHTHGEYKEKRHKATAFWLIIVVIALCLVVPAFFILLAIPKS